MLLQKKIDRRAIKYKKEGWCQCCAKGRFLPQWLEENTELRHDLDKDTVCDLFEDLISVYTDRQVKDFRDAVKATTHKLTKKLNTDKLLESKLEGTALNIAKFIEKNGERIRELEKEKCQKGHSPAGVVIEYKQKTKPIEDRVTDLVTELGDMKIVAEEEEIRTLKKENAKHREMLTKERKHSRTVSQENRELVKEIKTLEERLQKTRNSQSERDKLATECEKRNKTIEEERDRNQMLEKKLQSYQHMFREVNKILPLSEKSDTIERIREMNDRLHSLECKMIDADQRIEQMRNGNKTIMEKAQAWKTEAEKANAYALAIFEGNKGLSPKEVFI